MTTTDDPPQQTASMTLDEAIAEIDHELAEDVYHNNERLSKALRLSREALHFRQRWEDQEGEDDFPLLPGEAKDSGYANHS